MVFTYDTRVIGLWYHNLWYCSTTLWCHIWYHTHETASRAVMRSHGVSTAQHLMRVRFAKVELAIQGAALQSIQLARSILTEALPHIYWSHRAMMEPNIKAKNKFLDKANECGSGHRRSGQKVVLQRYWARDLIIIRVPSSSRFKRGTVSSSMIAGLSLRCWRYYMISCCFGRSIGSLGWNLIGPATCRYKLFSWRLGSPPATNEVNNVSSKKIQTTGQPCTIRWTIWFSYFWDRLPILPD